MMCAILNEAQANHVKGPTEGGFVAPVQLKNGDDWAVPMASLAHKPNSDRLAGLGFTVRDVGADEWPTANELIDATTDAFAERIGRSVRG